MESRKRVSGLSKSPVSGTPKSSDPSLLREIPLPLSSSHPPHNHETPSTHRESEYREGQDDRQPHPWINSRGVEKGERHSHGGEVDHGKHKDATQASPLFGDAADTNVVLEHELKEENDRQRHDRNQQPDFAGGESEDYCDEDSAQNDVQEKASRNFDPSPETAFSTGHAYAPSTSPRNSASARNHTGQFVCGVARSPDYATPLEKKENQANAVQHDGHQLGASGEDAQEHKQENHGTSRIENSDKEEHGSEPRMGRRQLGASSHAETPIPAFRQSPCGGESPDSYRWTANRSLRNRPPLSGPPARFLSMRIHTAPDANIPTTSTTTPSHIGRMISAKKTRPANVAASTNPTRYHRRTSRGGIPRYMPKPLSTQSGKAPPEGNHLILGTFLATTLGAFRAVPGLATLKIMPTARAATKPKIAARILPNQIANKKRGM